MQEKTIELNEQKGKILQEPDSRKTPSRLVHHFYWSVSQFTFSEKSEFADISEFYEKACEQVKGVFHLE